MGELEQAAGGHVNPLDPMERTRRGMRLQSELRGEAVPVPRTVFEASWRDFVFAEVWAREGLDRRSRFLISMSGAACEGGRSQILEGYIRGALTLGELTLAELREAVVHFAVYGGWARADGFDAAVTRVADELGLPPADYPPIRDTPWDPEQRLAEGAANFKAVMILPGPPPVTPYYEGGILNFVFGEIWRRPGLDERGRRWITLTCVTDSGATVPIRSHTYAALASGNATSSEMQEFVLHYAIHGSWPKASVIQSVVIEMGARVAKGLPFE